ncbi:hypothetical protein CLCR_05003 [Cladophialophora carrionii]|uniref:Myb-like domain-containing protein n=1 Tax=Cladophialophora carrionii TaxID=86049 RepID=A0A1C1CK99_9EURO|nr:hypothetical protein CLCR_05003 [Cladophialophora carrionii]
MSNLFNQPWTPSEQIALLTNIIQSAGQDVPQFLLRAIEGGNIQPRWEEMALPAGRTLNACRAMFEHLRRSPRSFSGSGLYHQPIAPYPADARGVPETELPPPTQRPIQPRPPRSTDSPVPPTSNGEQFRILRAFGPPEPLGERRRKRGRPTKEEAEERDRRLAESGQTYEPKRRPTKKSRPSGTPSSLSEFVPTTSPVLSTPLQQHIEAKDETSSGKRRSRRRGDEEGPSQQPLSRSPLDDSGDGRSTDAAQSPSDRLLARPERSQAIASISRDVPQAQSPSVEPQAVPRQDDPPPGHLQA